MPYFQSLYGLFDCYMWERNRWNVMMERNLHVMTNNAEEETMEKILRGDGLPGYAARGAIHLSHVSSPFKVPH